MISQQDTQHAPCYWAVNGWQMLGFESMITNLDDLVFGVKSMTINEGSKCYMNNFIELKITGKINEMFP